MSEPELLPPDPVPAATATAPTSGLAITSLVAGLLAWISSPLVIFAIPTPLAAIVAIVCGHMARAQIRRDPNIQGNGMAIAGLVLGWAIVACFVALVVFVLMIFGGIAAFFAYFGVHGS